MVSNFVIRVEVFAGSADTVCQGTNRVVWDRTNGSSTSSSRPSSGGSGLSTAQNDNQFGILKINDPSRYGGKTPWGAGGGDVVATESVCFSGGYAFDTATGLTYHKVGQWGWWKVARKNGRKLSGKLHKHDHQVVAVTPDGFIRSEGAKVFASTLIRKTYDLQREAEVPGKKEVITLEDAPVMQNRWSVTADSQVESLIVAGNTALLGTHGKVSILDRAAKKITWSAPVDGVAHAMAAAGGRLYVSTDKGTIYCFSDEAGAGPRDVKPSDIKPSPPTSPYPAAGPAAKAAEEIIHKTGVTRGYCLDLGCGDGALAYELARRTELYVVAMDPDPANVDRARRKLDDAGMYGVRAVVLEGNPADTKLPDYFADLVVSSSALSEGAEAPPAMEIARLQRPYGGVVCLGEPGRMTVDIRGELKGAGSWTHQFADAGNTMNSGDTLVKGPLGVLWYQDETLDTVQRHGKGPAPLFYKSPFRFIKLRAVEFIAPNQLPRFSFR
jgi:SAM-dependent methyltransferase